MLVDAHVDAKARVVISARGSYTHEAADKNRHFSLRCENNNYFKPVIFQTNKSHIYTSLRDQSEFMTRGVEFSTGGIQFRTGNLGIGYSI